MNLFPLIMEHMYIVLLSIAISAFIGIFLGVAAYWVKPAAPLMMGLAEAIQTIPSLALLAMLMIFFGLGNATMIAGLVLYSLLPIMRNTHTGLTSVSQSVKDAAKGMGMSKVQQLLQVELPLSFPLIFSGLKIALVNALSIAVMGVLIGAGGLGYPIYRGIQTRQIDRILTGALPVVLMALLFDALMSKVEQRLSKRGQS